MVLNTSAAATVLRRVSNCWVLCFLVLFAFGGQAALAQNLPVKTPAPAGADVSQSTGQNALTNLKTPHTELGIIKKHSIFFPDLATSITPLTAGQKFKLSAEESVSPLAFISAGASAAWEQAFNSYSGYGQGWGAYGERFGAGMAITASANFFGTFAISSAFHDDPRHFVLTDQSNRARIKYAVTRQFVGRKDDGSRTVNLAKIFGPLMAEALASTYLPPEERTAGKTFKRYGARMSWGIGGTLLKEYWPTIFKSLGAPKKLNPVPEETPASPSSSSQHQN